MQAKYLQRELKINSTGQSLCSTNRLDIITMKGFTIAAINATEKHTQNLDST